MDTPSTLGHFETAPSTLNFLIETPLGFNYFELSDYQIIWGFVKFIDDFIKFNNFNYFLAIEIEMFND